MLNVISFPGLLLTLMSVVSSPTPAPTFPDPPVEVTTNGVRDIAHCFPHKPDGSGAHLRRARQRMSRRCRHRINRGGTEIPPDPLAGLGQVQDESYCGWTDLAEPLPATDPAWAGKTAKDGVIKWKSCAVLLPGTPGAPGNFEGRPVELQFFPNDAAAASPPPPDPAVLAQEAIGQLKIPSPRISVGPDRAKIAVNLWTWLWIDDPGALAATVAAGGVSVTATATLGSVTWSLGEPTTTGDTFAPGAPATVMCEGAGIAPTAADDWQSEPPCGYKYRWRSTKERTGGTGTWPITATSNWDVTWQSNTGVTGATTLAATANDAFDVGEFRTVLVQHPGG